MQSEDIVTGQNTDQKRRPTITDPKLKQRTDYCLAWEKSGLSKVEFCKNNKLSSTRFYYWYNEYQKKKNKQNNMWLPVLPIKPAIPATQPLPVTENITIEMLLPNQTQLKLVVAESKAVQMIQEICHAITTVR